MNASTYTLIVLGQQLDRDKINELAALSGAPLTDLQPGFARFSPADPARRGAVCEQADQWGYDAAYIRTGMQFRDIRLIVSDMDSTLINIECIDEMAAMHGVGERVADITERSMRGELDFAGSLRERVALLEGMDESVMDTVYKERMKLQSGARDLLSACRRHDVRFMLVSGGFTFFTERLKTTLGLDHAYANQLETFDGRLTGKLKGPLVDAAAKRDLLRRIRSEYGLAPHQVLAVGDGANDLMMLREAGIGVAFHAKPVVRHQADIAINHHGLDAIVRLFAPH